MNNNNNYSSHMKAATMWILFKVRELHQIVLYKKRVTKNNIVIWILVIEKIVEGVIFKKIIKENTVH